ncbi:MAG: hypothetical protein Fur0015_15410 [Ignavibacteriales bacterium]
MPTLIYVLVIVTSSLFVYVFTKSEVRKMLRNKDLLQEKLVEKHNQIEASLVEMQKLSTEERIVELAQAQLSMIKNIDKPKVIKISKEKLEEVQEIVRLEYE